MVKLSTIFECFFGIILVISLVLFTGGLFASRSTIDAVPVTYPHQTELVSEIVEPELVNEPIQVVSEPGPESESMTFVSSYTPPVYNRRGRNKVDSNVQSQVEDSGSARVIVTLSDSRKKDEVLNELDSFNLAVDMKYGFAGYVDEDDLQTLESNEFVLGIDEDLPLTPANAQSFPQINADKAIDVNFNGFANLTGAGQTVCIIDTGVEYNHDDLGNCTGTEFLTGNCDKTIAGYDFHDVNDDPVDENGHGTGMAGIIAGNGAGYKGLAPDAKIVAMKITDASGNGWGSLLSNAVQWCTDNASQYNITTISIGLAYDDAIFDYNETFWCANANIANAVNNNITVFAPTGNQGDIHEISYPACNEYTIATSAVADGSDITPIDMIPNSTVSVWDPTRFAPLTDLMAPGEAIYTLTDGETYATKAGTSYASAHVVGSAMLLREFYEERYSKILTPAEIRNILTITGKPIWDSNTSAYYPRIDVLRAIHYEEWAPELTLYVDQVINVEPGTDVVLDYLVVDNEHGIENCSLVVNGIINQTNYNVNEGITESFTLSSLSAGTYSWKIECYDNSTIPNKRDSSTYDIFVESHSYRSNAGMELIGLDKVLGYDKKILNTTWPTLTHAYLEGKGKDNLTGRGQTVCIIDSGINHFHQEFNNGKQVGERDIYENDNDAQDSWNHGTRVNGIMTAKGINMQGLAHNANFVNLRITNSTGGDWTNDLVEALDWCYDNRTKFNITTVYIGIGTGLANGTETACTPASSTGQRIQWLTEANITVVASAGIDSNYTRINYPACVKNAIAVGAVPSGGGSKPADTWNLTAGGIQSNRRYDLLDILAPGGSGATATTNRSNYIGSTRIGTHMATAYVAGSAMLFKEYWDGRDWNYSPSGLVNGNIPNTIEMIFSKTGKLIEDENNLGVYYPRLDLYKAIHYEEYPPVVNTITNDASGAEGMFTIDYSASDAEHGIKNCSLFINSSLNQTNDGSNFSVDLIAGRYDYFISCYDNSSVPNNANSSVYSINVTSSDTTPPGTITALNSPSKGTDWIYWAWTNPVDGDFAENIIFIDGTNVVNTSNNFYNATGLVSNTSHTITVHTKDTNNNINNTDVNGTVTTDIIPDVTPPVISNVINMSITNQSVQIEWDTDEPSNSSINYGITTSLGTTVGSDTDVIAHDVDLINLQANTTYFYNVTSCDASNNCATDGPYSFTTDANIVDTTPPVISNVGNTSTTNVSVTIEWDTDENSNSTVEYGTTLALGSFDWKGIMETAHAVPITGLTPNTTYFYNVTSCDASNNCATDGTYNFTTEIYTAPNQAPNISGIPDENVDEDTEPSWQVDLWAYSTDDNPLSDSSFTIVSESNTSLIDCSIISNRYVNCSTPSADNNGFSDITVQIEDEESESATDIFRVTVNSVNDNPTLNAIANITANEGDLIQITPSANDVDGDTLIYSFEAPLNTTGGWQTGIGDAGLYIVNVSVDDGNGGVDSQLMSINVSAIPPKPDLIIKALQLFAPHVPNSTSFVAFKFIMENIGAVTAENVEWRLDTGIFTNTPPVLINISPGQEVPVFTGGIFNTTGDFNITVDVDYGNSVSESNETNNQQIIPITVS